MRSRSEAGGERRKGDTVTGGKRDTKRGTTASSGSALRVPHDPINEQVILAAVMVDRAVADRLLPTVLPEHLYGRGHAEVWTALRAMQAKGLYYDPATVAQMSGGVADITYLEQLIRDRPSVPPNLAHHVECLHWDRVRVEAVKGPLGDLHELLKDLTAEPGAVRGAAARLAESFAGAGSRTYLRDSDQVVREYSATLAKRRSGQACYGYGIPGLDLYGIDEEHEFAGQPRLIPGSAPGKTTLVTGVSGSGKTTLTARIATELALSGRRVCFGAWEQGEGPTLELCAALSLGWSRTDLAYGRYTEEDQEALEEEMRRIGENLKFFRLPFGRARGEKLHNDRNLDLIQQVLADAHAEVFIADLMRRAFKETDPDDEEQALYRLQAMADEQAVHHIWIHQQRFKDLETRPDKRPTREGTKGSGAWIEVPDTVLAVHRQALWKSVTDDRIEILVLKQRFGPWPLAVELDWAPEYGHIGAGKSVEYARPGEATGMDAFLGEAEPRRGRGKRGP